MKFEKVQAVLFDLDGTLIDSAPDLGAAVDKMRVDRGMPSLPLSHYRPMAGAGARGMIGLAFGFTPDHPDYEVMKEEFFQNYEACMTQRTFAFEGVSQLIAALVARHLPWGVVTNKHERFTHRIVERMAWLQRSATVICGDTTPHAKPHPAPLLHAAVAIGIPAGECIYVGDDLRDIQSARAAGMPVLAAGFGYLGFGSQPSSWGADGVIDSPLDTLNYLARNPTMG